MKQPLDGHFDGLVGIEIRRDRIHGLFGQLIFEPLYDPNDSKNPEFYYGRNPFMYTRVILGTGRKGIETFVMVNVVYEKGRHMGELHTGKIPNEEYLIRISESGGVESDLPETLGGFGQYRPHAISPNFFVLLSLIGAMISSDVLNDIKRNPSSSGEGYEPFEVAKRIDVEMPGIPERLKWKTYDGMQRNTEPALGKLISIQEGDSARIVGGSLEDIYGLMKRSLRMALSNLSQN